MKNIKTYLQVVISLLFCINSIQVLSQQHTLFSHYNFDHFMFNPGAAGSMGVLSANFFHRDQWSGFDQAPSTQLLNVHAPFRYSPFAIGGHIYNDNEGFLNNLRLQIAPAYQFTVNERGNLGLGLGLNLQRYQLKSERNGISQIPVIADPAADPTIQKYSDRFWKFHLTPGIYYNDRNFYGGISLLRLFEDGKDQESSTEDAEALRRHWLFLAGYHWDIDEKWNINPSILFRSERAAPANLDINATLTYDNLIWLNLGYRTSKMFMIGIGVNLNNAFKIGYNYDVNLNPLGGLVFRNSHEMFLSYQAEPEIDTDLDGVIDRLDKCPNTKGFVKYDGCPEGDEPIDEVEPKLDTDNDGIIDEEDDCPNTVGIPSLNGCPEPDPVAKPDSDNDGIIDEEDDCPNIAGTTANKGCPEEPKVVQKDSDNDGVLDKDDRCPNTFGYARNFGCPDEPKDSDGDGVIDKDDDCPDTFGDANNRGCPKPAVVDTDGDGIIDEEDNCPNTFGEASNNGCPKPAAVDTDGDGVNDSEDDCPNAFGDVDNNGCPKPVDTDGDGVIDTEDNCPDTYGLRSNAGCPQTDSDEDGIPDADDDCPNAFGFARNNGCPDAPKLLDSDADGVPDERDPCPNVYGNDNGCPEKEAVIIDSSDTDGDGVIDSEDDCPNTYGSVSNYGCPATPEEDSDGDGIVNSIDNCPYVFGSASNNGCPANQTQTVSTYQDILYRASSNLLFSTGSPNIEYSSFTTLNDLAELLTTNPSFRLRIAGHTDNVGAYAANMDLSRRRAEAVRDYLLNKGVSFGNMIVEYYGGTEPIADNATPEGRKKNRRVDFELIEN